MLKIIGLLCIAAGGAGAGLAMSRQVDIRYRELKNLQRMTALLAGEISYGNTPLPEALHKIGGRLEGPLSGFLHRLSHTLLESPHEPLSSLFAYEVHNSLKQSHLKEKDKEELAALGSFLGYLDKDMQLKALEMYQMELEREIEDTCQTMSGKKKLYCSVGIMGGLFLVILFL